MPSEKELAIYQGVLRLLQEGADIHALKASDIAEAAGLGKGTLYNYFSSKEEILLSTIRYTMEEHFRQLTEAIDQQQGFEKKLRSALEYEVHHQASHHQTWFLLSYFGVQGMPRKPREPSGFFQQMQRKTAQLMLHLARLGQEEGILGAYSEEEVLMAFTGAFAALSFRLCAEPSLPAERLVTSCYEMLVRGLQNPIG